MTETEITGDSKAIVTNQPGIHEKLLAIVNKHVAHPSQKPIQAHTQQAFDEINAIVQDFSGEIILDSCCGVGQSTRLLAKQNPTALVIGVDKSAHRINRNVGEVEHDDGKGKVENYHLVRADLYPNPWPKAKHVQRRWHGSAVFPQIIAVGQEIILRSNWLLYLEEFQLAAEVLSFKGEISTVSVTQPLTPFEAKFHASGQQCWQLDIIKS